MAIFPKTAASGSATPVKSQTAHEEDETILRVWRGWTAPENADSYEALIRAAIFPGILGKAIAGLEGSRAFFPPARD